MTYTLSVPECLLPEVKLAQGDDVVLHNIKHEC